MLASKKQKQDLIAALKFTPRDIRITLSGYGGEIVMGHITEAAYDYWNTREDDLSDYIFDWDGEQEVPADADFAPDGSWYDVSDICHESGVEMSNGCWLTVTDELTGETLLETTLAPNVLESQGIEVECTDEQYINDAPNGSYVFLGQSSEKGVFMENTVRITQPFDPAKLRLTYGDYEGWELCSLVEYDDEDIEGMDGYNTRGKSSHFRVFHVEKEEAKEEWDPAAELDKITGDMPVLEGEEMWASRMIDYADESERWEGHELSPWWDGTEKPVRAGRYQVLIGKWPFEQFAEWDGERWTQDGEPVSPGIWRGLHKE